MVTTVLVAGAGTAAAQVTASARRLAVGLTGTAPDHVLALPADATAVQAALDRSDLLVVASALADGRMDSDLGRLLERQRPGRRLAGCVGFALTVGDWPVDAGVVHAQLVPALQAAGATCLAPGLHLARPPFGSERALATYTAFWSPVVQTLTGLANRPRAAVA